MRVYIGKNKRKQREIHFASKRIPYYYDEMQYGKNYFHITFEDLSIQEKSIYKNPSYAKKDYKFKAKT